jgi:hypothetical protein
MDQQSHGSAVRVEKAADFAVVQSYDCHNVQTARRPNRACYSDFSQAQT